MGYPYDDWLVEGARDGPAEAREVLCMSSTEVVPDAGFEESSEISGWLSTEVSPLPPTPGRLDTLDMTLSDAALRGLLSGFSLSEKKFELSLASSSLLSFLGAACILPRAFDGTLAADIIPVS